MWFPSSRIQTLKSTLWVGQGDRPQFRKIFLVLLEEHGVRYWSGDVPLAQFLNGRPPIATLNITAKRDGLQAVRPFSPGQEWDPAARQIALLNADAAARARLGMGLEQVGWEGGRIVPSAEIALAEEDARWQGGIIYPEVWTSPLLGWMLRGLEWAREPQLARVIQAKLDEISQQAVQAHEELSQPVLQAQEEEVDNLAQ